MSDLLDWMNILQENDALPSHLKESICEYCRRNPASLGHKTCKWCENFMFVNKSLDE